MELDFAMLALGADHSTGGKLHIFGGAFDLMTVEKVPALIPPFTLVARFLGDPEEIGKDHHLSLAITNPKDERSEITKEHLFRFSENKQVHGGKSSALALITLVVSFQSYGTYVFDVGVDGKQLKRIPLTVTKAKSADKNA